MKKLRQIFFVIFAFLLIPLLAACSQDASTQEDQETQAPTQKPTETEIVETEPLVRLYFRTRTISADGYIKYEYSENWWEKNEFTVTVLSVDTDGAETSTQQNMNVKGEVWADATAETGASFMRYEEGLLVYSRGESAENDAGHLSITTT